MGLLDDYRAKFPQYDKIPDDELEEALYKKYYSDKMPRADFYKTLGAKDVAQEISASGTAPVESSFETMVGNIPGSAANLAKGVANTAVSAAGTLVNPDPRAKIDFIKNQATGIVGTLKERYGNGLGEAMTKDPVGVLADAISLFSGVRGGLSRGGVAAPSEAAAGATRGLEAEPKPQIPTTEELHTDATSAYKRAEDSGIVIKPEPFVNMVRDVASAVKEAGFDKDIQQKSAAALRRLGQEAVARKPQTEVQAVTKTVDGKRIISGLNTVDKPATPITLSEFDTVRQVVNQAAQSIEKNDRRIAGTIKGVMDDFLSNLTEDQVTGGKTKEGVEALTQARGLYSRYSKSSEIDTLFDNAALDAPNFNAAGYENALRQQFKSLAKNQNRMRKFSPDEQNAIRLVAKGSKLQSAFTKIGKFSPTSGFFAMVLSGELAARAVLKPELLLIPGIGSVAKYAATKMRSTIAENVRSMVAGGKEVSDFMKRRAAGRQRAISDVKQALPLTGSALIAPEQQ